MNMMYNSLRNLQKENDASIASMTEFILLHSEPARFGISALLVATVLIYFTFTRILSIFIRNRLSLCRSPWIRNLYIAAAAVGIAGYEAVARFVIKDREVFLMNGNG